MNAIRSLAVIVEPLHPLSGRRRRGRRRSRGMAAGEPDKAISSGRRRAAWTGTARRIAAAITSEVSAQSITEGARESASLAIADIDRRCAEARCLDEPAGGVPDHRVAVLEQAEVARLAERRERFRAGPVAPDEGVDVWRRCAASSAWPSR